MLLLVHIKLWIWAEVQTGPKINLYSDTCVISIFNFTEKEKKERKNLFKQLEKKRGDDVVQIVFIQESKMCEMLPNIWRFVNFPWLL